MQTTSITVVSETSRIGRLQNVAEYIETECPYLCIDMTTALENTPGVYKDVVIPTAGPVLVRKTPLLGWSPGISAVLKSTAYAWVRFLLTIISFFAVTIVFFIKDYTDVNTRMGIFLSGALIQSLLNFLEFSNYRGKIMKEVMTKFEFWYLAVVHTVAIVGMGWLYIANDLETWCVVVGLVPYVITFPLTVFAIDGSFNSPRSRSITMMLWMAVYLAFGGGCGVLGYFSTNPNIHTYFINYQVNLYVVILTAQSAVVACTGTLVLHFAKYALMMWRGRMYVLVYFEIQTGKQEIGTITHIDDDDIDMDAVEGNYPQGGDEGGSGVPPPGALDASPVNDNDAVPLATTDSSGPFTALGSQPFTAGGSKISVLSADAVPNFNVTGSSESFSLGRHSSNVNFMIKRHNQGRRFTNAAIMQGRAPRRKARTNVRISMDRTPLTDLENLSYDAKMANAQGGDALSGTSEREKSVRFLSQPGAPVSPDNSVVVTSVSTFGSNNSLAGNSGRQVEITNPPTEGGHPPRLRRKVPDRTE